MENKPTKFGLWELFVIYCLVMAVFIPLVVFCSAHTWIETVITYVGNSQHLSEKASPKE